MDSENNAQNHKLLLAGLKTSTKISNVEAINYAKYDESVAFVRNYLDRNFCQIGIQMLEEA